MLEILADYCGVIEIDGVQCSKDEARRKLTDSANNISSIILRKKALASTPAVLDSDGVQYIVSVRQYMTKKASANFDFMAKWNNDNPMPLMTMVGTIEKETAGMYYMKLHGDITVRECQHCMKCGKPITNPVSKFFGMGPECGGHNYVNPFASEEELNSAIDKYRREYLQKIEWQGWIIKSAIISKEELK